MKKILIVGQGIAGTLLACTLRRRGADVHLADPGFSGSSSSVAAGVINPVTGKRFVKSWRFEEFFPVAKATYQRLEQEYQLKIWYDHPIIRLLSTPEEFNNWTARCAQPEYAGYLEEPAETDAWSPLVKSGFHFGAVLQAARVDFSPLLQAIRDQAHSEGWLIPEKIDYQKVALISTAYDHLIFCEGAAGFYNPFFPGLPWQLAKGEALWLRFQAPGAAGLQSMLKKNMMLVPLGQGVFWAGGSYNWTFEDSAPSAGEKAYILNGLQEMLQAPFDLLDHRAAIRPTVKDRRPFLGLAAENPVLGIFNGLGTKGALLAPYWAEHLADHILEGKAIDPEVDIARRF